MSIRAWTRATNENLYSFWRWHKVRPILESEVCPRLAEPAVRARWERYAEADRPSRAELIIREQLAERRRRRRAEQSVLTVCPAELVNLLDPTVGRRVAVR